MSVLRYSGEGKSEKGNQMSLHKIESFTHANRTVTIYLDPEPFNPLTECDILTTLACWHRRARLGNRQIEGQSADDLKAKCEFEGDPILAILPLYIYEHSGITMSTGSFSDHWDSGQVGWGYVTRSRAEAMGCVGPRFDRVNGETVQVGEWDVASWEKAIEGDVKAYDSFLTGECYGYKVTGIDGDEIDSCWGFLGDVAYCREEARAAAEGTEDPGIVRQAAELEARVTYAAVTP